MLNKKEHHVCYHCGESCPTNKIRIEDKFFCCSGCLSIYRLLHDNDMEQYYCLNPNPGQKMDVLSKEKFAFLEEESIVQRLLLFRNKEQAQVSFYLPQMHCSSCLWLLEHLSKFDDSILSSQVNFTKKTVKISFDIHRTNLRQLAELLAHLGYEPVIDLNENNEEERKGNSKRAYLKVGVTGFCFSNIMLIAFPEYLGLDASTQPKLVQFFTYVNVFLSLPVVFYGAREFFVNAWYSIRQRYLNIDVPIALAIAVTWLRSLYEVFTQTGAGFFDSMSGIVFFMLLGRTIQNRSYTTLKFNRDYKSYFPLAVTKLINNAKSLVKLEEIKEKDVLLIHHQEVIPTDCLLSKGHAEIDYSFLTGEDRVEAIEKSEVIYAGGRNVGSSIEVVAAKSFNQNSFIQLWNQPAFHHSARDYRESRINLISKYFSVVVLGIAFTVFAYWSWVIGDSAIAWKSATAVLIIACPCALLLTASFTNGYLTGKLAKNGVYLKNTEVIERISKVDFIAFDKTGTLTEPNKTRLHVKFLELNSEEISQMLFVASQSLHPLSRSVVAHFSNVKIKTFEGEISEHLGKGIEGKLGKTDIKIGSALFVKNKSENVDGTSVFVSVNDEVKAHFSFEFTFLPGVQETLRRLSNQYELAMISGDNASAKSQLQTYFGDEKNLHFDKSPKDKLEFVKGLQDQKKMVMMLGDGLNDAGALKQSDVGVAVVNSTFAFSPACDVILDARRLKYLPDYMRWTKEATNLINWGFAYSIVFNIIGLSFAVAGNLSPLIAAILMPSSTVGIVSISYWGVRLLRTNKKDEVALASEEKSRKVNANEVVTEYVS